MDGFNRLDRDRLTQDRYPDERAIKNRITTRDIIQIPPRPPRTVQPGCKGPPINRDLKPRRKFPTSQSDGRFVASTDRDFTVTQRPVRSLPRDQMSLPPIPSQTISDNLNRINASPPARPVPVSPQTRRQNYQCTRTETKTPVKSRMQSSGNKGHISQRFSLDLESQDLGSDCVTEHNSSDSYFRRQQNHEWPPTKEDSNYSGFTSHNKPVQGVEEQNWYVGAFSRVDTEHALHLVNREGAFLVRDCSRNTTHEPFVLVVFYDKRVFNIQIRFSEETSKYTLGTGLRTNERFDSVTDIIKFHSIFPIILIDGRKTFAATNQRRHCVLMYPITKKDMTELQ